MDFVIDIQGFRDSEKKFLPKEVAITCLQKKISDHWIVQAPHSFDELPREIKETNTYLAVDVHGIHWFDGEVSIRQLHRHLYNIARVSRTIYVRGVEKARYIEALFGRRVINLEKFKSPTFKQLNTMFPDNTRCSTHSTQIFTAKKEFCALYKVNQLKKWMRSILPLEWKVLIPKNKVTSDMYLTALYQYSGQDTNSDESDPSNDIYYSAVNSSTSPEK